MSAIGRKGGQIGGKRRLKTMTKAERSKVAAKAAKARWKKVTLAFAKANHRGEVWRLKRLPSGRTSKD
jgi:hypothetical protein